MRRNSRFQTAHSTPIRTSTSQKGSSLRSTPSSSRRKPASRGADRWAIYVQANDARPEEIITLQSNDERDAELYAAAAHIEKHGPIRNTKLVKSGKAYYFRNGRSPRAPSVSNDGGPAIALDRPSGLVLLWQSVNQSREAVKAKRKAPRTAAQYFSRPTRQRESLAKTAHVLSAMRSEGISLRKASRELGVSSQTVRRHAGASAAQDAKRHVQSPGLRQDATRPGPSHAERPGGNRHP